MTRETVLPPEPFAEEAIGSFEGADLKVRQRAVMAEREVQNTDPEAEDDRCGLLNDRFEIYAVRLNRHLALGLSIDRRGAPADRLMVHGLLPEPGKKQGALRLVLRHRGLVQHSWET